MAKVKPAPQSFERWKSSLEEFLYSYGQTLEDTSLNLENLFKRGVNPVKALHMILGLSNAPEEDIEKHTSIDTYLIPFLDEA